MTSHSLNQRHSSSSAITPCSCRRRSISLFSCLTVVVCCGFTWPGKLPHLAYVAAHGSANERLEAVQLLSSYTDETAREALLSALEDRDGAVQLQAAETLGLSGVQAAAPRLIEWTSAADPQQRAIALRALAGLHSPRALELGARALGDAEPAVRAAAIALLAQAGAEAQSVLLRALDDRDAGIRLAVVQALGAAPSAAILPELSELARDHDASVREASLRALGHTRDARALPVLVQDARDPVESVRLAALAALGDSGSAAAVAQLKAALIGDVRGARTAAAALGRLDDPRALQALFARQEAKSDPMPVAQDAIAAALERARRLAQPAEWSATAAAVSGALSNAPAAHVAALSEALCALAPFTSIEPARAHLLTALRADPASPLPIIRALLALAAQQTPVHGEPAAHAGADLDRATTRQSAGPGAQTMPELPTVLLERLPLMAAEARGPWLDALELTVRAGQRAQGAEGVLTPLIAEANGPVRARLEALLALLRDQPAQPARAAELARVTDRNSTVRAAAISALADSADDETLRLLARQLDDTTPAPILRALSAVLISRSAPVEPKLRAQLLERLAALVMASDGSRAAHALDALRSLREPRAAAVIAHQLRIGSVTRRAQAVCALADFPNPDTRRLLRYTLHNDGPRVQECAALALAEVGDERDAGALLQAAGRGIWPLPAAAAYALARIAQRGVAKKHNFARGLCRLRERADLYVQANLVAGLAALGSEGCGSAEELPRLRALLSGPHASALRVAVAQQLQAAPARDELTLRALASCSADPDREVARACARRATVLAAGGGKLDLYAHGPDGAPWRERPVALRFESGLVFVGRSDPNGHVLLPASLGERVVFEDPADAEPAP